MLERGFSADWKRIVRYYEAGIVNTLFGYGIYALLVALGLNIYVAQLLAHALGVVFNFITYSRYTFADQTASKPRFLLSYGINYLLSVALLWGFEQLVESPYISGLLAVIVVSLINFLVLKKLVFKPQEIS